VTRRDAVENRARVLDAAIEVFGEHGVGASTDVIAVRAQVGAGTVFRHFPTKQVLLEAVFERMLGKLADHARTHAAARDAGAAFFDVLEHMIVNSTTKKAIADSLAGGGIDLRRRAWAGGLREAITALLVRAQAAGAVRDDIGIDEVMAVLVATSRAVEVSDRGLRERTIAVLLDGLRPRAPIKRRARSARKAAP